MTSLCLARSCALLYASSVGLCYKYTNIPSMFARRTRPRTGRYQHYQPQSKGQNCTVPCFDHHLFFLYAGRPDLIIRVFSPTPDPARCPPPLWALPGSGPRTKTPPAKTLMRTLYRLGCGPVPLTESPNFPTILHVTDQKFLSVPCPSGAG